MSFYYFIIVFEFFYCFKLLRPWNFSHKFIVDNQIFEIVLRTYYYNFFNNYVLRILNTSTIHHMILLKIFNVY